MVRLGQRDLRDALEFVHAASAVDSSEPFPQPTVDLLAQVVPGEFIGYSEWDSADGPRLTMAVENPVVPTPPDVAAARREYCSAYPLSMLRRNSETRALKISDFVSLKELHRLDYYDSVLRPFRIEHQMRVWLSAPAGTFRFFSFSRVGGQRDFGERDRSLLDLLRPFLVTIRERFELRQAQRPTIGVCLTEREEEILRWVARGKTNQEIASLLFVSPHTVRKHLENAYEKLGVHSRTAAIARAFSDRNQSRTQVPA
jgi:DNA-binding CsgD family transcriptional regulator